MAKTKGEITKRKMIRAAWDLFYEKGYDNTTIDDILLKSKTSKSSFYYYFDGKDSLLSYLSTIFDDEYERLEGEMPEEMGSFEKLLYLNHEMNLFIENKIDRELLASLYSSQLVTKGQRHLLDQNRFCYKLLNRIIFAGQQKGELRSDIAVQEITKVYMICERSLVYDWCLCGGQYSLTDFSDKYMPMFLREIKN
jgi:AcrR family transcriptional regulator